MNAPVELPPRSPVAETALTADQRAVLRASLQKHHAELARRVFDIQGGLSRVEHAADQLAQDGDDAPQRDADREVDLARNDWALRSLDAVREALIRVDTPAYGACTDCGEPIAFKRLRIEPWVLRCTACQSRAEAR